MEFRIQHVEAEGPRVFEKAGLFISVWDKRQPRTGVHSQLMPKEGRAEPENLEWIVRLLGFHTR